MIDHTTVVIHPVTRDLLPSITEKKTISISKLLITIIVLGGTIYVLSKFKSSRKKEGS